MTRKSVTLRLDVDLVELLNATAERLVVGRNLLVELALDEALNPERTTMTTNPTLDERLQALAVELDSLQEATHPLAAGDLNHARNALAAFRATIHELTVNDPAKRAEAVIAGFLDRVNVDPGNTRVLLNDLHLAGVEFELADRAAREAADIAALLEALKDDIAAGHEVELDRALRAALGTVGVSPSSLAAAAAGLTNELAKAHLAILPIDVALHALHALHGRQELTKAILDDPELDQAAHDALEAALAGRRLVPTDVTEADHDTATLLLDVVAELDRAAAKFGDARTRNIPGFLSHRDYRIHAPAGTDDAENAAKALVEGAKAAGTVTWLDILIEEHEEAANAASKAEQYRDAAGLQDHYAHANTALYDELIQVAAVALRWASTLDTDR